MTDPLESRLQQAAAAAARAASAPQLSLLRGRARRRRVAMMSAPLALSGALAAMALQLQSPDRDVDRVTPPVAGGRENQGPVTFTVNPPDGAVSEGRSVALERCLGLSGVTLTEPVALGRAGGATATVTGADNIQTFDGCVSDLAGFEVLRSDEAAAQAAAAQARWQSAGISDYTFRLRRECFCPVADFVVTVRDGQAIGIEQIRGDGPRDSDPPKLSIDDLFALIRQPAPDVAAVQAVYDAESGFPKRVDVDAQADSIDDEYSYLISDLQPADASS